MQYTLYIGTLLSMYQYHSAVLITPLLGLELPHYMRLVFLVLKYFIKQYRSIYQYIYVSVPQCSTDHRPVGLELPDCVTWIVSPRVLN